MVTELSQRGENNRLLLLLELRLPLFCIDVRKGGLHQV